MMLQVIPILCFLIQNVVTLYVWFDILQDSEVHLHWKGAAEIVLSCCTSFIDKNGLVVPLGDDKVCGNVGLIKQLIC